MPTVDYDTSTTKLIPASELQRGYVVNMLTHGFVTLTEVFNFGDRVSCYYSHPRGLGLRHIEYPIDADVEVQTTGDGF